MQKQEKAKLTTSIWNYNTAVFKWGKRCIFRMKIKYLYWTKVFVIWKWTESCGTCWGFHPGAERAGLKRQWVGIHKSLLTCTYNVTSFKKLVTHIYSEFKSNYWVLYRMMSTQLFHTTIHRETNLGFQVKNCFHQKTNRRKSP